MCKPTALLFVLYFLPELITCCTEVFIKTYNDSSIVVGRTLEFHLPVHSRAVLQPKGTRKRSFKSFYCGQTTFEWTNKFDVFCIDGMGSDLCIDAINTAGLSAASLHFPGFAKYDDVTINDCGNMIPNLQLVDFIVGNFHSTDELRKAVQSNTFPKVFNYVLFGMKVDIHISIVDSIGDAVVLEYTKDGRTLHRNEVQVVTGSPSYDFHVTNLKQVYSSELFSNDQLLRRTPSDYSSTSRFVRAVSLLRNINPITSIEGVSTMFHLMNAFDIVKGVFQPNGLNKRPSSVHTQWIVVKDLKNLIVYFRSYFDFSIRKIELKDMRPGKVEKVAVERCFSSGLKDLLDEFYLNSNPKQNRNDSLRAAC